MLEGISKLIEAIAALITATASIITAIVAYKLSKKDKKQVTNSKEFGAPYCYYNSKKGDVQYGVYYISSFIHNCINCTFDCLKKE